MDELYALVCRTLVATGHEVVAVDLVADGFRAVMSAEERLAYHGEQPVLDADVSRHSTLVAGAEALVFVFRGSWSGLPAVLKGWLERVLVPGVAFHLHPRSHRVRSDLRHVRRIAAVTVGRAAEDQRSERRDPARRVLLRALRMLAARRCRSTYLSLTARDATDPEVTARFARRVGERMGRL